MSERTSAATAIASNPSAYKVCDQCESIMKVTASCCALCHSYHWRKEPEEVRRVAQMLGSQKPRLAPVSPRF